MEVWAGDMFLGEAWLPRQYESVDPLPPAGRATKLCLSAPWRGDWRDAKDTRLDPRKCRLSEEQISSASLCLAIAWEDGQDGQRLLSFGPARGEGLPLRASSPRLLLWARRSSSAMTASAPKFLEEGSGCEPMASTFEPLWASREATDPSAPMWSDTVTLSVGKSVGATRNAPPSRKSPRPRSAQGRLETAPKSTQSVARSLSPCHSEASCRPEPQQFSTRVASTHATICGATVTAHWGFSEDGAMMTHVLAEQVMTRLGSGTKARRAQMTDCFLFR